MENKEIINILIKKIEKKIPNYDYYSENGKIFYLIEETLNILKIMNGEMPFEDWYLKDLLESEVN